MKAGTPWDSSGASTRAQYKHSFPFLKSSSRGKRVWWVFGERWFGVALIGQGPCHAKLQSVLQQLFKCFNLIQRKAWMNKWLNIHRFKGGGRAGSPNKSSGGEASLMADPVVDLVKCAHLSYKYWSWEGVWHAPWAKKWLRFLFTDYASLHPQMTIPCSVRCLVKHSTSNMEMTLFL